jgi:hypothetical protein
MRGPAAVLLALALTAACARSPAPPPPPPPPPAAPAPPGPPPAPPPSPPDGWRAPDPDETAEEWRDLHDDRALVARGDFDGDGAPDEARLVVREDGSGAGLVAYVSGTAAVRVLAQLPAGSLRGVGVLVVRPGRYDTVCGTGAVECEPDDPTSVTLAHDAVEFFRPGGTSVFFYWDPARRAFQPVWVSD